MATPIRKSIGFMMWAIYANCLPAMPCDTDRLKPAGGVLWAISTTRTARLPSQIGPMPGEIEPIGSSASGAQSHNK